ncbi:MAG: beta-ketoacyl-[acyl-carrier-protein] synthase family protein [Puniceicoccales bacterium]|jgi:3-oxoacyl-[acyl-carrier-protein] synthase-1|nr:beta-ketoacyl-[acyl-carrier-protein] synthase family protein [Puniceicoccales bacterium]
MSATGNASPTGAADAVGNSVVVTGLGFVSSIGNDRATVTASLRALRHGLEPYPPFEDPRTPVKLTGTIKGFDTTSFDPEDWTWPADYKIKRDVLRGLPPHGLYAYCAVQQALADARLTPAEISNPRAGMFTASAGSVSMLHHNMTRMFASGVMRCSPMGVVNSVVGTLSFNLVAAFKILGASCGFASACASSGHALGYARDEIALGRQDRMLVVGGEDGNLEAILPFAGMRALSPSADPALASCPFDRRRSGFVGTGGAAVLVLENEALARARGADIYARFRSWGQASDGYSPAISHPEGQGLSASMTHCLAAGAAAPADVDYINAHATSTPIGDRSEILAIKRVFGDAPRTAVSSTKGLTGHGLSMASVLEAAICCLALRDQFIPGNAHLREPDPDAAGLALPTLTRDAPADSPLRLALSNSSGFGGANVSLLFERA